MNKTASRLVVFGTLLLVVACNLPSAGGLSAAARTATALAATLTALPTSSPIPTPSSLVTPLNLPTATAMLPVSPAPQEALVLTPTLCWAGPGPVYEVISGLKKSIRVPLLGRDALGSWWIVENPFYHDPCWAMAKDLQINPGVNTAALPIFAPPPTPTPSFTPSPVPTATATFTATP